MKFLGINKCKCYMLVTCRTCFRIKNVSFFVHMGSQSRLRIAVPVGNLEKEFDASLAALGNGCEMKPGINSFCRGHSSRIGLDELMPHQTFRSCPSKPNQRKSQNEKFI